MKNSYLTEGNIGKSFLMDKFVNSKINDRSDKSDKSKNFNYKKSGLFTGTKASLTYNTNHQKHMAHESLTDKGSFLNNKAKNKLNESIEFLENVVYKRNLKTIYGTNSSAVPHGVMQNNINTRKPYKPANGKVPTMLNTSWGQREIQKKYRNAAREFKNLNGLG